MTPETYLYGDSSGRCYMLIHKCILPGKNANLYLIGDVFLRHFYSVYDFEKDQVALGVDIHSEGKVFMHRPEDKPQFSRQLVLPPRD
jgi:hypothetical protein